MYVHMGVSINGRTRRTPIVGWFIIGKSIYTWTIFWVPSFQETSIYIYTHCQSARYPAKNDKFFAGERRYSH